MRQRLQPRPTPVLAAWVGASASLAMALPLASPLTPATPAAPVFVDASATAGNDDGTSWQDAHVSLDTALAAHPGGELWVAAGIYLPSTPGSAPPDTTSRSHTFELASGTRVHGGFAGWELSLGERVGLFDSTVLSGDLPVTASNPAGQDAYSVVTVAAGASGVLLDGFRVTGGVADAGLQQGARGRGAGIYASGVQDLELASCTVAANVATEFGGGLFVDAGRVRIKHTVFEHNVVGGNATAGAWAHGGGAYVVGIGGAEGSEIHATVFRHNLVKVEVGGNGQVNHRGGGLYFGDLQEGHSSFSTFATQRLRLFSCLFHDNVAPQGGGAAVQAFDPSAFARLVNCTLAQNRVSGLYPGWSGDGEALSFENGGTRHRLTNSIVWSNGGTQVSDAISVRSGNPVRADYCVLQVQSSTAWTSPSGTILQVDPRFRGPVGDDFELESGSPCVDVGKNGALPRDRTDLDGDGDRMEPAPWSLVQGRPRVSTLARPPAPALVDLGAHERAARLGL